MPSMSRSTSKVPILVRQGWPPLTVPVTLISFRVPTAALNTAFWVPRDTRSDVSTSCTPPRHEPLQSCSQRGASSTRAGVHHRHARRCRGTAPV